MTKAELRDHCASLGAKIERLEDRISELQADLDHAYENLYSEDTLQDLIQEAIEDHDRAHLQDLQRYEPETHRARFQLIQGGAA